MFSIGHQGKQFHNWRPLGAIIVLSFLLAACDGSNQSVTKYAAVSKNDAAKLHDTTTFKIAGNPDPSERIAFSEFSIVAPQGERWIERRLPEPPSNYAGYVPRVTFVKILQQTSTAPHTVIAAVSRLLILNPAERVSLITNPRDFMQYMMNVEVQTTKLGTDRLRVNSIEAKMDETLGVCYRLDVELEDRGVYGFPNTAFILDVHQYECADPDGKFIAKIEYSQRRSAETPAYDMSREGEDFLKSFRFAESQG